MRVEGVTWADWYVANDNRDAFAGGFVAGVVQGKNLDECVDMGHWLASLSIRELGPRYVLLSFVLRIFSLDRFWYSFVLLVGWFEWRFTAAAVAQERGFFSCLIALPLFGETTYCVCEQCTGRKETGPRIQFSSVQGLELEDQEHGITRNMEEMH